MANLIRVDNTVINLDAVSEIAFLSNTLFISFIGGKTEEYDLVLRGTLANKAWDYINGGHLLSAKILDSDK
ncbi:MAG: hypothetical protein KIT08_01210 [Anaerolineales bacterium]|nr:MAG: hypothetical protein KIT08_01210 [Anaerolineales bacterium]